MGWLQHYSACDSGAPLVVFKENGVVPTGLIGIHVASVTSTTQSHDYESDFETELHLARLVRAEHVFDLTLWL